jgi:hypothetical protein
LLAQSPLLDVFINFLISLLDLLLASVPNITARGAGVEAHIIKLTALWALDLNWHVRTPFLIFKDSKQLI